MGRPAGHPLNRTALDDLLAARGATRASIAVGAGVSPSVITDLATGRRRASTAVARRIADALGCHVTTLFPGVTDDGPAAAKSA